MFIKKLKPKEEPNKGKKGPAKPDPKKPLPGKKGEEQKKEEEDVNKKTKKLMQDLKQEVDDYEIKTKVKVPKLTKTIQKQSAIGKVFEK